MTVLKNRLYFRTAPLHLITLYIRTAVSDSKDIDFYDSSTSRAHDRNVSLRFHLGIQFHVHYTSTYSRLRLVPSYLGQINYIESLCTYIRLAATGPVVDRGRRGVVAAYGLRAILIAMNI